jgi:hypothetical protein
MAESGVGKVTLFDDFIGFDVPIAFAVTAATHPVFSSGGFKLVGQGLNEADAGAVGLDADGLNGIVQLTTTNEDIHSAGLATNICYDMNLNGGIVLEARVRMAALTARAVFFGITDVMTQDVTILAGSIIDGGTTTTTLTASDLCGFHFSSEYTDSADWHGVYNGGSTTGETTSTSTDLSADATAGEFQILKLTVGNDGTARWYVDGVLKQTVKGAASTSVDFGALLMVEANAATIASLDVDYLLVESSRDWTV